MPILAQAKWLVRPEYCRYTRSSTAGTSHTGGVSSYLFLFLCFAMADLPIQDIDIGQVMAMAAAQQRKVEEWCNAQGIETEADLAYMFTSHSEALREAGRAVADAWSASRVNVQRGLAVPIRQIVREAEAVSPPVVLKRAPSAVVLRVLKAKIALCLGIFSRIHHLWNIAASCMLLCWHAWSKLLRRRVRPRKVSQYGGGGPAGSATYTGHGARPSC